MEKKVFIGPPDPLPTGQVQLLYGVVEPGEGDVGRHPQPVVVEAEPLDVGELVEQGVGDHAEPVSRQLQHLQATLQAAKSPGV